MKLCIIYQGPSFDIEKVKNSLKNINETVIFSTWAGEDFFYNNNDLVIFQKKPKLPGFCNLNYQKMSTLAGLHVARQIGFSHALKIRSDFIMTNAQKTLKFLHEKPDKFAFLHWQTNNTFYPRCPGYLTDFINFGEINQLIELWSFENCYEFIHPEITLTKRYTELFPDNSKVEYLIENATEDNYFKWLKNDIKYDPQCVHFNKQEYLEKKYINKSYSQYFQ
jgi:hypothetical protein